MAYLRLLTIFLITTFMSQSLASAIDAPPFTSAFIRLTLLLHLHLLLPYQLLLLHRHFHLKL
ncbi:Licodione synthase [Bienertia sinuspersici]